MGIAFIVLAPFFVDIETLPPDTHTSATGLPEEVAACSDGEFRRLALDCDCGRVREGTLFGSSIDSELRPA